MNAVFADTSFYAAIVNRRDQFHVRAKEVAEACRAPVITTEFVLIETANFCLDGRQRTVFLDLVGRLRAAPGIEIIAASADWFQRGLDIFAARSDKPWSLTDCISFAVMHERQLTDALTADHNFEQAGFHALLR